MSQPRLVQHKKTILIMIRTDKNSSYNVVDDEEWFDELNKSDNMN